MLHFKEQSNNLLEYFQNILKLIKSNLLTNPNQIISKYIWFNFVICRKLSNFDHKCHNIDLLINCAQFYVNLRLCTRFDVIISLFWCISICPSFKLCNESCYWANMIIFLFFLEVALSEKYFNWSDQYIAQFRKKDIVFLRWNQFSLNYITVLTTCVALKYPSSALFVWKWANLIIFVKK